MSFFLGLYGFLYHQFHCGWNRRDCGAMAVRYPFYGLYWLMDHVWDVGKNYRFWMKLVRLWPALERALPW